MVGGGEVAVFGFVAAALDGVVDVAARDGDAAPLIVGGEPGDVAGLGAFFAVPDGFEGGFHSFGANGLRRVLWVAAEAARARSMAIFCFSGMGPR